MEAQVQVANKQSEDIFTTYEVTPERAASTFRVKQLARFLNRFRKRLLLSFSSA